MKKIILSILILAFFIFLPSCSKSKDAKCKELAEHGIKISINSPMLKKLSKNKQNEIKEIILKNKYKGIESCIQNFDENAYKCAMKTKNLFDSEKCIKKYPNFFKKWC